jgi:sterol 3beta-glucosyltransferase
MKILITTIGSRGDIQPFVALGKGLHAAGHEVVLCTAEGYRPFVEEHGLTYGYMNNDFLDFMRAQEGQAAMEGNSNKFALLKQAWPILRRMLQDEWQTAQSSAPDLMIHHPKALGSDHIGERLGIPVLRALPLPVYTPTRAFPNPIFGNVRLGGWLNRLSYRIMTLQMAMYGGIINEFRRQTLGLPPKGRFTDPQLDANGEPAPVLYAYSRHVLPVPADYPPHVHVTGYWFLAQPQSWQPAPELVRFLEAGPPPVYIGFGSMGGTRAAARGQIVLDAVAQAGQRALLASGWGGLTATELPNHVYMLESAPHDWLFPRMAAVVHHGGAGTTAAGLAAGKPTLICPFIVDQPFWGRVVHDLGVGPAPIPQKKLTAAGLAAAIQSAVSDTAMQQRAAALGEKIRAENGVARAVEVIDTIIGAKAKANA